MSMLLVPLGTTIRKLLELSRSITALLEAPIGMGEEGTGPPLTASDPVHGPLASRVPRTPQEVGGAPAPFETQIS